MNYKNKFYFFILFIFIFNQNILAESPRLFLSNMLEEVKELQSLEPALENVDWEYFFEAIDPGERAALGYNTADDLKNYYILKVKSKGQDKIDFLKKESGGEDKIDSEERSLIDKVNKELKTELSSFNNKIASMYFDFASSNEEKDSAEYFITRVIGEDKKNFIVKLRLSDNQWLIDSAIVFNPLASPDELHSPLGKLPEPTQVLFNP